MKTAPRRRSATPPQQIAGVVLCLPPLEVAFGDGGSSATWAIGKPGVWRALYGTVEVTAEMLQTMAETYDPINNDRAALNFDHTFGGPAQAWVDELFMDGELLMAGLSDFSKEAIDGIRSRQWRRVSMEIDRENPLTKNWYLMGVALLGAANPAIKGLPEVTLAASGRMAIHLSESGAAPAPPTDASEVEAEGDPMGDTAKSAAGSGGAPANPAEIEQKATTPAASETPPAQADTSKTTTTTTQKPDAELASAATATSRADEALAAANQALERARALEANARLQTARNDVDQELRTLRDVLPPAVLSAGLQELLVQLKAAEQPMTLKFAAKQGEQPKEATAYQVIVGHLRSIPKSALLTSARELATAVADEAALELADTRTAEERETHRRMGLKDEDALRLAARRPRAV